MNEFILKTVKVSKNVFVAVEPTVPGYKILRTGKTHAEIERQYGEMAYEECERIISEIERHVDDFLRVYTHQELGDYCFYCNSPAELDEDGRPVCCERAIQDYNEWAERQIVGEKE